MENYSKEIGIEILKLFLEPNELDYLEMIGESDNAYRVYLQASH